MTEHDVINRIQELLKFKHWSVYKLAQKSDLPYSSLNNIFNRKTCPSIITLEKICSGLGISLAEFFNYKETPFRSNEMTLEQQELLNAYDSLSSKDKELLQTYLRGLCKK